VSIVDPNRLRLLALEAAGKRGPESDPKGAAGRAKTQLVGISPAALVLLGEVMRQGSAKYGYFNWSSERMKASTYYAAALRHLLQWWTGEEQDAESGVDHLAHLMACAMILLEQRLSGQIIDDRPTTLVPFVVATDAASRARAKFDALRVEFDTLQEQKKPLTDADRRRGVRRSGMERRGEELGARSRTRSPDRGGRRSGAERRRAVDPS